MRGDPPPLLERGRTQQRSGRWYNLIIIIKWVWGTLVLLFARRFCSPTAVPCSVQTQKRTSTVFEFNSAAGHGAKLSRSQSTSTTWRTSNHQGQTELRDRCTVNEVNIIIVPIYFPEDPMVTSVTARAAFTACLGVQGCLVLALIADWCSGRAGRWG